MGSKITSRSLFGISIYEGELTEIEGHLPNIIEKVQEIKRDDKGLVRSNKGGWHSSDCLSHLGDSVFKPVIDQLQLELRACLEHAKAITPQKNFCMSSSWININHSGDWNAPHAHFNADWSGVLYLKADEISEEICKSEMDGNLILINPLSLGPQYQREPCITAKVRTGRFFLFPSYLVHMVAPHYSPEPRISLAFNLSIQTEKSF